MSKQVVKIFKALSDETRIDIVYYLLGKKELSCQDLSNNFSLSQPAMSHHFSQLIDTGIINVKKVGASHFYSLNRQLLERNGIYLKRGGEK